MKNTFTVCNLYLILLVLSFMGSRVFPLSIAKTVLIVSMLFSLYYCAVANAKYALPSCFKVLNVLVLMFTVYGVAFIVKGDMHYSGGVVSSTSYLLDIYTSLLPSYAFYVFAKRGEFSEKLMKTWLVIFLFAAIIVYYQTRTQMEEVLYTLGVADLNSITNNTGYAFVGLLPALVAFRDKPFLQYAFLAVCGFFVLLSVKRGAILIFAVVSMVFLLNNFGRNVSGRNKIKMFIITAVIIVVAVWFVDFLLSSNDFFLQRVNQTREGDSSGRAGIHKMYFQHFMNESNLWHFLFGNGANGGLGFAGVAAHNDWLEIAISQGVVGIVLYFLYWKSLYSAYRNTRKYNPSPNAIGVFIIIYFMSSWFSMSYNSITGPSSMALGYCLATYNFEKNNVI